MSQNFLYIIKKFNFLYFILLTIINRFLSLCVISFEQESRCIVDFNESPFVIHVVLILCYVINKEILFKKLIELYDFLLFNLLVTPTERIK